MATIAKVKKGDTVMLCMFTGMRVGPKEVVACDKDTVTISRNKKGNVTFSRKTGKQLKPMPKNERFASYIEEDDGTYVHPTQKKKKPAKKSTTKKATKKAKPEPEGEEEDAEEKDEQPASKKATKKPATKKKAAPKPAPEPEDDDDDDKDEDWDDDDFEEVE